MREDRQKWEKELTEEEKAAQEAFEETLRVPAPEGDAAREAFMKSIEDVHDNRSGDDGLMNKEQFRQFNEDINAIARDRGIKEREITDEFIDMAWAAFNGFRSDTDGVTKKDLMYVLSQIAM